MIKRTVSIGSPAKLSLYQQQMHMQKADELGRKVEKTVPKKTFKVLKTLKVLPTRKSKYHDQTHRLHRLSCQVVALPATDAHAESR